MEIAATEAMTNSTSNIWWIGPVVLVAVRLLYAEARSARAEARGTELVFRPVLGFRVLAAVGVIGILFAIVLSGGQEEAWVYALAVGLLVLLCFGVPATIMLGGDGVRQQAWWGRKTFISWGEISGLEKRPGGEMLIYGCKGNHSRPN